nr:hypothetical protein [uncultured bacterium]
MLNDLLHGRDDDPHDQDAADGDGREPARYPEPERSGVPGTAAPGPGDGPRPAPRPAPPAPPASGAHRLADATDPEGSLFGRDGGSPTWPPTFGARGGDQWSRPGPGYPTEPRPPAPPSATAPAPPPAPPLPPAPAAGPHELRGSDELRGPDELRLSGADRGPVGEPGAGPVEQLGDPTDSRPGGQVDDRFDDRADDQYDDRADDHVDDPVAGQPTTAVPAVAVAPVPQDADTEPTDAGPSGTASILNPDTDRANTGSTDIDPTDNGRAATATTFAAAPAAPLAPTAPAAGAARSAGPAAAAAPDAPEPLVPRERVEELAARWDAVKGSFVDDPRDAVTAADDLVGELLDELDRALRERRAALEDGLDGDDATTEDLRQALRRYRSFFDRLRDV